jgi:hypothetical protein
VLERERERERGAEGEENLDRRSEVKLKWALLWIGIGMYNTVLHLASKRYFTNGL